MVSPKAPDVLDIRLGAAVRLRRRLLGLSQEGLGEICGVTFQQIQKYENGANRISFSRLTQIACALKCSLTELVALSGIEDDGLALSSSMTSSKMREDENELLNLFVQMPPQQRDGLLHLLKALTTSAIDA